MRFNALVIAVLALVVVGSVGAAGGKPKLVRVVRRDGDLIATLTYVRGSYWDRAMTLTLRRGGRLLLERRLCPTSNAEGCAWLGSPSLRFVQLDPAAPAVVVDLDPGNGESTFIALPGTHVRVIARDWWRASYRGEWLHGKYYFVSGDNRFMCAFTSCAGSWLPSQTWAVRGGRLADVTWSVPLFSRVDAKRAWRWYLGPHGRRDSGDHGVGILAGWCADEYVLGHGAVCRREVRRELAAGHLTALGMSGPHFVRQLNRDLTRWGYKRHR